MQNTAEIQQRVQRLLLRLPVQSLESLLSLLEALVPKEQAEISAAVATPQYDFSDLTGRLCWRGNAVAAQRALRDEW